ncbi:hypothetical protein EX30DRAFT_324941 [Ascodesmis nigricans]|uniref:COX assembly mitochondrial protein n=1 Tax=Ascodesmis nigricans TaxID=341454 RepID=A0A4S2MHA2_9PEZI|nr:hypothetical protein EX30DRAFT_324941 [Ascodesmis nigricans]
MSGPSTATVPDSSSPSQPSLLTRNPLPLSAAQEAQVRDLYYARVRGLCAEEIRIFADCARGKTVSATWMCRQERQAMNRCMIAQATPENMDAAREEWFKKRLEKRRAKEEAEKVKTI